MPVDRILAGVDFDNDLELDEDSVAESTLRVRVQMLRTEPRTVSADEQSVTIVHFRAPLGSSAQRLEISARRMNAYSTPYESVCAFTVDSLVRLPHQVDFCFPEPELDAFRAHGLRFPESLPVGHLFMATQNVAECRLLAPVDVQATADVDGDSTAGMVQRKGDSLVIWARSPMGDHALHICVRRGGAETTLGSLGFAHAVTYRLSVLASCQVSTAGFPERLGLYHELNTFLEEPRLLQHGLQFFRLHLDPMRVSRVVVMTGADGTHKALDPKGGRIFEGQAFISGPEVKVLCAPAVGEFVPLLRWSLADCPASS